MHLCWTSGYNNIHVCCRIIPEPSFCFLKIKSCPSPHFYYPRHEAVFQVYSTYLQNKIFCRRRVNIAEKVRLISCCWVFTGQCWQSFRYQKIVVIQTNISLVLFYLMIIYDGKLYSCFCFLFLVLLFLFFFDCRIDVGWFHCWSKKRWFFKCKKMRGKYSVFKFEKENLCLKWLNHLRHVIMRPCCFNINRMIAAEPSQGCFAQPSLHEIWFSFVRKYDQL